MVLAGSVVQAGPLVQAGQLAKSGFRQKSLVLLFNSCWPQPGRLPSAGHLSRTLSDQLQ